MLTHSIFHTFVAMKRSGIRLPGWGLIVMQALLLLSLIWFGIHYHREFEQNLTDKYRQQLSHTSATARLSVLSYFEKFSENLINLAHNPEVIRITRERSAPEKADGYCPLETMFNIHRHEIDALILMDTGALVIKRIANDTLNLLHMMCIGHPKANPNVPEDSVYYSDIFINHKNQKAITLSCPVYDQDQRIGILRWMITIESINNHFLNAIQKDMHVHFTISDQEGRLLSNIEAYQEWLCRNLCQCEDFKIAGPFIESFDQLEDDGSGKLFLRPLGCEVYSAWSSLSTGNKLWKVIVMMPASLLDDAMLKHGIITYSVTALALFIMLSITILYYTTRLKKSRLETEAKYLGKLADSQMQLNEEREKRLSAQITGQERERHRISRELHDGLGQLLLAMRLRLKGASDSDPVTGEICNEEISGLLNETIDEVKRISYGLSPVMLLELGIVKALGRYCQEMAARSGIKIEFVSYGISDPPAGEISTHLFRIAQEALSNAIRHANPSEIDLQLLGSKDKFTLVIQDNGNGFEFKPQRYLPGNGIDNMRDRVTIINGQFEILSVPGTGTTITVKIPIKHE